MTVDQKVREIAYSTLGFKEALAIVFYNFNNLPHSFIPLGVGGKLLYIQMTLERIALYLQDPEQTQQEAVLDGTILVLGDFVDRYYTHRQPPFWKEPREKGAE